jgi:hypothetical protein
MHKASGMAMAAASSSNNIIIICMRWYQRRSINNGGWGPGEGRDDDVPHGERRSSILLIYAEGRTRTTARASFFYFLSLPSFLL